MKNLLTTLPLLTLVYLISWIVGIMIGFALFPAEMPADPSGFDLKMILVSFLHAAVFYVFLRYARTGGWSLFASLVMVSYGLTFFITQVETIWFNDTIGMDRQVLNALLVGGLIASILFSALAVLISGKKKTEVFVLTLPSIRIERGLLWMLLIVFIWPMIYFIAGYYIAWQFADVRVFYSGSEELKSFAEMMKANIADGLYLFQVLRSFIWIAIALVIHYSLKHQSVYIQMLVTGALFGVLGSSQLLLANPLMPETVRYVHLLETFVSTTFWGAVIAYVLSGYKPRAVVAAV
jgi:hypothetical protein